MPIRKDQEGRWHIELCVERRRVHRRLPENSTKKQAEQLEAELRTALARRQPGLSGDPLLVDVMGTYLAHAHTLRSPATATYHALRIGQWVSGQRASEAREVAARIVADMLPDYAPATINRSLGTLKKALRIAFDQGEAREDFGAGIRRLPENNARDTYLSLRQVQTLARHASPAVAACIWIAIFTGMRRGEIVALQREHILRDSIHIPAGNTKTFRTRTIPIIQSARPWLKQVPLNLSAEGLKSGFRRAREAAGMPEVRFHDLRHSCASLLIQAKVALYTIGKILGHSSVRTTERYAHLEIGHARAGLKKLDDLHRNLHQRKIGKKKNAVSA